MTRPTPQDTDVGLEMTLDEAPSSDLRATLAREINDFHSRTIPFESRRFAVVMRDRRGALQGAVIGVMSWGWLFIEAAWVADSQKGQGRGRALMEQAEAHARSQGCHSAWLDTFQAREFYLALGYETFGVLPGYPNGQSRHFLRKALIAGG